MHLVTLYLIKHSVLLIILLVDNLDSAILMLCCYLVKKYVVILIKKSRCMTLSLKISLIINLTKATIVYRTSFYLTIVIRIAIGYQY